MNPGARPIVRLSLAAGVVGKRIIPALQGLHWRPPDVHRPAPTGVDFSACPSRPADGASPAFEPNVHAHKVGKRWIGGLTQEPAGPRRGHCFRIWPLCHDQVSQAFRCGGAHAEGAKVLVYTRLHIVRVPDIVAAVGALQDIGMKVPRMRRRSCNRPKTWFLVGRRGGGHGRFRG